MLSLERLLKVVDPEPVHVNQQACLRARHVRSRCRACSESCPAGAIEFADRRLVVNASRCASCGLCAGACPTAALQVRGVDERLLDGALEVRCMHASGTGIQLPCLGDLSVDHLTDLGSRCPGLTLKAGDCDTCPLASGGRAARANLAAAAEVLLSLGVSEPPVWQTSTGEPAGQGMLSRRELFSLWRHDVVQTGRSLIPDRNVNPVKLSARVPARRLRWLKRFAAGRQARELTSWPVRQVAGECNGCGICTAFCPTGALGSRDEGEDWLLGFQPAACVNCQTCLDLCPRHVIKAEGTVTVDEVLGGTRRDLVSVRLRMRPQAGGIRLRL